MANLSGILTQGHKDMLDRVWDDLQTAQGIMDELEPQGLDFSKEKEENKALCSACKGFLKSFFGVDK